MLKKAISVALLAGFIAGLFVTVIQSVLVSPLILEAESYEQSASAFRLPDSGEKPWRLIGHEWKHDEGCLLYTSPSPRDYAASRMPSSA